MLAQERQQAEGPIEVKAEAEELAVAEAALESVEPEATRLALAAAVPVLIAVE